MYKISASYFVQNSVLYKIVLNWTGCFVQKSVKAPALKESSFGTKGDRQTFFDQIFNFCLHNIIARKVLSNFCFGVPSDSFIGWRLTQYQVEDQAFFSLTGNPNFKKFYLFKDKSFWLEIFFIFQGYTRATFLCTFRGRRTSGEFSVLLRSCIPIVRKSTNFLEKLVYVNNFLAILF